MAAATAPLDMATRRGRAGRRARRGRRGAGGGGRRARTQRSSGAGRTGMAAFMGGTGAPPPSLSTRAWFRSAGESPTLVFAERFRSTQLAMKTNSHETNMTHEVKATEMMKHYKFICFLGVALITWIDKAVLLNRLNEYSNVAAQVCTIYFTIALVSMLLGLTASSFPDSALCAKMVSSNGALQAFLFLNAVIHLHSMKIYPEFFYLAVSYVVTSLVLCIYWVMKVLKIFSFMSFDHKLYVSKESLSLLP